MVFTIPTNLAPETYPMAWLVDDWRGAGILAYEGVEAAAFLHELRIDNDNGGPYLRVVSDVWLAQEPVAAIDQERPGGVQYRMLTKGQLWSSLVGYLRVSPEHAEGKNGQYILEGTVAQPTGHAMTLAGAIQGPRFQFVADAIAATPTAQRYEAGRITGGYVESELFFAYEMAAFGQELRDYMSARLQRVGDIPGFAAKTGEAVETEDGNGTEK
ncbi:protein of unknown function [Actinobaculum suis]|uniref:FABP family protein n=1 Tax=Actinobaculum suis TaxID=1657 RepID=A0A1G7AFI7_9ACTO|nr:FABP family protein [Actinobaculum suis]MDY5152577.1 FABP family protein [Actinobaculum suis]SDE13552.1 protein of unknown function [Actinobaculum suis]